jgi:hypothetical protein
VDNVTDVLALPNCQLSATSYLIGYQNTATTFPNAVAVSVSGTTVTFGTPLQLEANATNNIVFNSFGGTRFNPNLFPLSATTAVFTYGASSGSILSRHVVLSVSGTTVTAGTILYGLWIDTAGGNFPQAADGFLAANSAAARNTVSAVTVSGTTLSVTGTVTLPGAITLPGTLIPFGVTSGARLTVPNTLQAGRLLSYRFRAGSEPLQAGTPALPNYGTAGTAYGIEVSPSRAAFTYTSAAQPSSTTAAVKLAILEFIA